MKKNLPPVSVVFALAAALLWLAGPVDRARAQPQTDAKIKLMSEALRARDLGDLATAQKKLAELAALAPGDTSVHRLQAEVDAQRTAQIDAAARAETTAKAEDAARADIAARTEAQRSTQQAAGPAAARRGVEPAAVPSGASSPAIGDGKITDAGPTPAASTSPATAAEQEADELARAESARLGSLLATGQAQLTTARSQARAGQPDDAIATLDTALASLPVNPLTQSLIADLKKEKASALLARAQVLIKEGDTEAARTALNAHEQLAPSDARASNVEHQLAAAEAKSAAMTIDPAFAAARAANERLIAKGRAQYLAGDIDGAQETFRTVEAQEPDNTVAKGYLLRIADEKAETGALNREKTRAQLLEEVAKGWQRPGIYQERARDADQAAAVAPLAKKLNEIVLPNFSFTNATIQQVVSALSEISEQYDAAATGPKGVNVVLLDPGNKNPTITLTLRNTTLKRVLDFVTEAVGYQYEVQADAVIVRPGGETSTLDTAFFPITRATVLRMTGISGGTTSGPAAGGGGNPYSSAGAGNSAEPAASSGEAASMKAFLQQAGVNFEAVTGASLAYDGSAIIVTQTARNIERIRNILARYNDVRQVEIESKFLEVQQGALEELGVQWNLSRRGVPQINPATGAPILDANGRQVFVPQETYTTAGVTRPLVSAFPSTSNGNGITIDTAAVQANSVTGAQAADATHLAIPTSPASIPGGVSLAAAANAVANITGFVGEFDVAAAIRALSQKQGSDLLSSPKVTVLSGNPANITVAQELRYPQSYGEIQSQVGSSSGTGSSGAGVTITAGTPQEFTTRNVGVELKVTPTVEEDDYSISLDLNPKVTEFEGFVEYGGPSIAISSGTTVTVPPGFYQPIFSVREISTKVTIWDGATLVMGGLTREEVKKVNDKVPFFGDIPLIGRLFRSKGESSQKRNLLIFVTANLVSPGGSPKKQNLKSTPDNSLFQNPTIVTPASSEPRTRASSK